MKTPIKQFSIAILVTLLSLNSEIFAQVGVGIASPNTNAMLDVTATNKGFLPPRLTTAERDALKTQLLSSNLLEDKGMLVFDNDLTAYYYWNGSAWVAIAAAGGYVDLTTNQTVGGMKTFTGDLTPAGRLMLPMGEISYFSTSATSGFQVDITGLSTGYTSGTDNMIKINPGDYPAVTKFVDDNFGSGNNSKLTYTGTVGRYFHIALSFSYRPFVDKDVFVFGVARTTVRSPDTVRTTKVEDSSKLVITTGVQADYNSTAMHVLLWLDPGDSVEFYVGNTKTSGNDVYIKSFNFVAIGM